MAVSLDGSGSEEGMMVGVLLGRVGLQSTVDAKNSLVLIKSLFLLSKISVPHRQLSQPLLSCEPPIVLLRVALSLCPSLLLLHV